MTKSARRRLSSYALLLVNTLCWGAALIIVKPAFEVTSPFRFLFYRYVAAIILTLPLIWYYRHRLPKKPPLTKQLLITVGLELIGTVLCLGALYLGLARTTAIQASLVTTTSPIFVTLLGLWWLKERQERHEWIGLAISFGGTILLTLAPLVGSQNTAAELHFLGGVTATMLIGNLLVILSSMFDAIYFVSAKPLFFGWPKLFLSMVSFYVGAVCFGLLSLWESGLSMRTLSAHISNDFTAPSVWIAVLYMAVFGSIIGLTAYIKGQEGVETSEASLFWYLQPLVFLPLGFILLKESIQPLQLVALAIILAGVILAEKRWRRH